MREFKLRLHKTQDRMTMQICTIPSAMVPQAIAPLTRRIPTGSVSHCHVKES